MVENGVDGVLEKRARCMAFHFGEVAGRMISHAVLASLLSPTALPRGLGT